MDFQITLPGTHRETAIFPYRSRYTPKLRSARKSKRHALWALEPGAPYGEKEPGRIRISARQWEGLQNVAMSLHAMRLLIDREGYDESSGVREIFEMTCQNYDHLIASIRDSLEEPEGL